MVSYIDAHRDRFGIESICSVLPIAPSTYHRRRQHQADPARRSARAHRYETLRVESSASTTSTTTCTGPARSGGSSGATGSARRAAPSGA
jgi:hypothetical protein